jgi:hypothetical protein
MAGRQEQSTKRKDNDNSLSRRSISCSPRFRCEFVHNILFGQFFRHFYLFFLIYYKTAIYVHNTIKLYNIKFTLLSHNRV